MEVVYCLFGILYHPKWHLCQNVVVHNMMLEVLLNFAISFRLKSLPYNCYHFVTMTSSPLLSMARYNNALVCQ